METREGFGESGNVAMFDDFPTATTVAESLRSGAAIDRSVIAVVLDELAFCMKTATRLGRVVRIGERWWGHPQTYGTRQMEVVDEYERTGISPDEFDEWAVLDPSDLITLVALRTGVAMSVVDAVVTEFCDQVESFHVRGIHFRTPSRELGAVPDIVDQLIVHPEVLAVHDHVVTFESRFERLGDAGELPLLCRYPSGGWLAIEIQAGPERPTAVSRLSLQLDYLARERAVPGETVRGLVLSDGYSQAFIENVMGDERVVHLNLRALDLPLCRAQRWVIRDNGREAGWVAVAADGRTVVGGGGPAFPTIAPFVPFERIPLDWVHQRLWPLPLGVRVTPGE